MIDSERINKVCAEKPTEGLYVVTYAGPIQIVGPFARPEDAALWGHGWQNGRGDDPRWNTIQLVAGREIVHVKPE